MNLIEIDLNKLIELITAIIYLLVAIRGFKRKNKKKANKPNIINRISRGPCKRVFFYARDTYF